MAKTAAPYYCNPHRRGVPHNPPPFFNDKCVTCQKKKAAGLVDGTEGPLKAGFGRYPMTVYARRRARAA